MKRTIQTAIIFLLSHIQSFSQSYQWSINYGGTGISSAQILSSVTDQLGNVYTTGCFAGTVDFDPGPGVLTMTSLGVAADAFITKTNDSGTLLFARRFGGVRSYTCGFSILLDSTGNIYFSGISSDTADFDPSSTDFNLISYHETDPFICKLSSWGTLQWVKNVCTHEHDMANYLAFDATGNITLAGMFGGAGIDFDPGPGTDLRTSSGTTDGFLLTLDTSGNYVSTIIMGGPGRDGLGVVAYDSIGNMFLTGSFKDSIDLDPGSGSVMAYSNGGSDFYILKLDINRNYLWSKTIGGPNGEGVGDLKIGANGDLYLTGGFKATLDFDPSPAVYTMTGTGTVDAFFLKLSPTGDFIWAKRIGGIWDTYLNGIVLDADDNIYATGFYYRTVDLDPGPAVKQFTNNGMPDMFVEALDSAGNYKWAFTVGGIKADLGFSICINSECQLYVTGTFTDSADFSPGSGISMLRSGSTYFDAFIQKLNITDGSCAIPLPIELISFDATLIKSLVQLKWTTASETNNSYFTVLKSRDGIAYDEFTRVEGAGNSSHEIDYFLNDDKPFFPYTYYRLTQTDFDGTTTVAGNTLIRMKSTSEVFLNWNMDSKVLSTNISEKNDKYFLEIYSSGGALISKENVSGNVEKILNDLSPGVYFATLTGEDAVIAYRFVIW